MVKVPIKKGWSRVKTGEEIKMGDMWRWSDNEKWRVVDDIEIERGGCYVDRDEVVIRKKSTGKKSTKKPSPVSNEELSVHIKKMADELISAVSHGNLDSEDSYGSDTHCGKYRITMDIKKQE